MRKLLLLVLFVLITAGSVYSQAVNIQFRVTDGTGTGIDTLRLGSDPTATDCIDASLGEAQLPPAPPSGVFDARFVGTNLTPPLTCLGQGIKWDFRTGTSTYVGTKIHQVKFQVGTGTSITFNYTLPAGVTGRIYDIITGTISTDTLVGTGQFVVTNPSVFSSYFIRINYSLAISPPAAPTLSLPVNGATGVSLTPLLDWNDVATATSYRVQVSANSGFTTTIVNDSTLTASQYTIASVLLSNNTTYYWRVNAKNTGGTGSYSTVFSFTTLPPPAPSAPTLSLPTNGATGVSLTPLLDWNDVATATSYRVQVSANSGFTTTIVNDSTLTSSQYTIASGLLANNTTYYWRVNAKNAGGTSAYSTVFSFTTLLPTPPVAPTLSLPTNGATGVNLTPLLDWNDVSGAASYRVQVSANSGFTTTIVNDSTLTASQYTIASGLLSNNTTYYWRVNAKNAGGTSAYSTVFSFTTLQASPPAAPTLLLPVNSATGVSLTPLLDWSDVTDAVTYRVQVSANSGFTSTIINDSTLTTSQYTIASGLLTNNTVYYWRVNAKNANGTGAYSSVFSFTTLVSAPSAPTLLLPTNGATNVSLSALLDWNDVTGATSYRVQVSANSGFTTTIVNDSTLTTSQYTIASGLLSYNTTYYWRVNAKNAGGTSAYSSVFSFTTLQSAPQNFIESFEGATFPPTGWVKITPTNGTGWYRITGGTTPVPGFNGGTITVPTGGGTAVAFCNYITGTANGGASGLSDQWLITPQITNIQPTDSLSFWLRKFGNYAENFQVKISTTTPTIAAMTTTVMSQAFVATDSGWVQYKFKIGSMVPTGSNIYIGFREWVTDVAVDGASFSLDLVKVTRTTTGLQQLSSIIPLSNKLYENYPNPFNPVTSIKFDVSENSFVKIKIFDILGKEIETLVNSSLAPGTYLVRWNAAMLPSGMYFYRFENGKTIVTKKMMLIK